MQVVRGIEALPLADEPSVATVGFFDGVHAGHRAVLGRSAEGALAMVRAPATGELYRHHLDRLAWMDELVAHHGVHRALSAADLETAHF